MDKSQGNGQYFCAVPSPVCFSWGLVVKPRGGAIASTGDTGFGQSECKQPEYIKRRT